MEQVPDEGADRGGAESDRDIFSRFSRQSPTRVTEEQTPVRATLLAGG